MSTNIPETLSFAAQPVGWQGRLHQSIMLGLGFGRPLPPGTTFGADLEGANLFRGSLREAELSLTGRKKHVILL